MRWAVSCGGGSRGSGTGPLLLPSLDGTCTVGAVYRWAKGDGYRLPVPCRVLLLLSHRSTLLYAPPAAGCPSQSGKSDRWESREAREDRLSERLLSPEWSSFHGAGQGKKLHALSWRAGSDPGSASLCGMRSFAGRGKAGTACAAVQSVGGWSSAGQQGCFDAGACWRGNCSAQCARCFAGPLTTGACPSLSVVGAVVLRVAGFSGPSGSWVLSEVCRSKPSAEGPAILLNASYTLP